MHERGDAGPILAVQIYFLPQTNSSKIGFNAGHIFRFYSNQRRKQRAGIQRWSYIPFLFKSTA